MIKKKGLIEWFLEPLAQILNDSKKGEESIIIFETPPTANKTITREDNQETLALLEQKDRLPSWTYRDGNFWLGFIGIKFYDEIKEKYTEKYSKEKVCQLLSELDNAIDDWNEFISKTINIFQNSDSNKDWRNEIFKRDGFQCRHCGNKNGIFVLNIVTLSELIANYIAENSCSIDDVNVAGTQSFYQKDNGITICKGCWRNSGDVDRVYYYQMLITGKWNGPPDGNASTKLSDIQQGISKKISDLSTPKDWFSEQLKITRDCQKEIAYFRQCEGNVLLEVQALFRTGDYNLARRLAIRQEKYWRRESEERRKEWGVTNEFYVKQGKFANEHWEEILNRTIDKLINLYEKGDFSIAYGTFSAYTGGGRFGNLFRESENEIRAKKGVSPIKKIGGVVEKKVFNIVKEIFPEYEVLHNSKPEWLLGQEFDIYIPELKLAVEYMGEQHYKPKEFFGGYKGFKEQELLDERKRQLASQQGVKIVYIRFDEEITNGSIEGKILAHIDNS